MNEVRPFHALGMPWHGLATNGQLTTAVGTKTINYDTGGLLGPCLTVRHPAAPGVSRNAAQIARDAAQGHEWRDYALLTGTDHNINGGPALGSDSWLYCDAGGATWVIRLEAVDNGATMAVNVWLDALFGRFHVDRPFSPQLLATLSTWAPDIPTWYSGPTTVNDVIDQLNLTAAKCIAPSADGASCFINVFCDDDTISGDLYAETQPLSIETQPTGFALVAVLEVAISGSGDITNNGAGITATLTENLGFEGGLVTNRERWISEAWGTPFSWDTAVTAQPAAPSTNECPATETDVYVFTASHTNQAGDNPYSTARTGREYDAILYKTPQGTVNRSLIEHIDSGYTSVTLEGAYSCTVDLSNCVTDGPDFLYDGGVTGWYRTGCTQGATTLGSRTRTSTRKYWSLTVTVFGDVYQVETLSDDWTEEHDLTQTFPGGQQFPNCGSLPSDDSPTSGQSATVNGQAVTGFPDMTVYHEVRMLAPNLVYLVQDYPQLAGTNRDMHEYTVGVLENGTTSEELNQATAHAPLATTRKIPDLRRLVWSWQPVSGESVSADFTLGINYSGDRYQYC